MNEVVLRDRLSRMLLGASLEPPVSGVVVVTFLSTAAFTTFWTYVGVWGLRELHASSGALGIMFLLNAGTSFTARLVGGNVSDSVGRKPLIVFGLIVQSAAALAMAFVHEPMVAGMGLVIVAGAGSGCLNAALMAVVVDVTTPRTRETAFAATRVALNLGVIAGPPIGGLLLLVGSWHALLWSVAVAGSAAAVVSARTLPGTATDHPIAASDSRPRKVEVLLDPWFRLFLIFAALSFGVYYAYDTVLPVLSVAAFGLSPAAWGIIMIINPIVVALFQVRLTKRLRSRSLELKVAVGSALMGLPFLAFLLSQTVYALVAVLFVFAVGEMVWAPSVQALAGERAPSGARGLYFGAFSAAGSIAAALSPLVALQLRGAAGDTAVWIVIASLALVAATVGSCLRPARGVVNVDVP